ncbi:MarR family winged helix-turn-helix transcriptional regulator [Streptomyces cinnamoneus]|uniref:MarR family winged helix-turn-helix transcriptional regulator n=1 Tax=Streptomyces cinnamoneus TaxID=53446 RepID=UPI00379A942A
MDTENLFTDPRLTALGLLLETHAGLSAKLEPLLVEGGVSSLDLNALMRLSRSPDQRLRMSDLAAQTSLSTSGITRLVDRLQRAGLVRRESFPGDRRSTYAVLTAEGADRVAQLLPDYLDTVERWYTGVLTPEQLQDFLAHLRVIRDHVHPGATAREGE